jgi:hypothetical protein
VVIPIFSFLLLLFILKPHTMENIHEANN